MIAVIADCGATTTETAHGPYDAPIVAAIGQEAVLKHLQGMLTRLQSSLKPLKEAMVTRGIPEKYQNVVDGYFKQRVEHFESTLKEVSKTPAVHREGSQAPYL